ncbi:MAG: hypothetical protein HY368_00185 [Candidatus Aenigmarchaeota archaeon]|nr:hypothetical protein [Candidatus Aenigmarchaeota archaeon]
MADKLNPKRAGMAVGAFAGLVHLFWALLVAAGLGQWWSDWKLSLHFLNVPLTVTAFNPVTAAMLVVLTFVAGFAAGWVFAWVWNWAGKWK